MYINPIFDTVCNVDEPMLEKLNDALDGLLLQSQPLDTNKDKVRIMIDRIIIHSIKDVEGKENIDED